MINTDIPLNPMERWALDTVEEILDKKDDVVPRVAHISEIRAALGIELLDALRSLCRMGVLNVSVDINKNPMFAINRDYDG